MKYKVKIYALTHIEKVEKSNTGKSDVQILFVEMATDLM